MIPLIIKLADQYYRICSQNGSVNLVSTGADTATLLDRLNKLFQEQQETNDPISNFIEELKNIARSGNRELILSKAKELSNYIIENNLVEELSPSLMAFMGFGNAKQTELYDNMWKILRMGTQGEEANNIVMRAIESLQSGSEGLPEYFQEFESEGA